MRLNISSICRYCLDTSLSFMSGPIRAPHVRISQMVGKKFIDLVIYLVRNLISPFTFVSFVASFQVVPSSVEYSILRPGSAVFTCNFPSIILHEETKINMCNLNLITNRAPFENQPILDPRCRDPFGQHQESRPLAGPNF